MSGIGSAVFQLANGAFVTLRLDYVGGTNPIYLGLAAPGTLDASTFWQIRKLTFDSNNNVTTMKFANGSEAFNQIWNNRTSLTYI